MKYWKRSFLRGSYYIILPLWYEWDESTLKQHPFGVSSFAWGPQHQDPYCFLLGIRALKLVLTRLILSRGSGLFGKRRVPRMVSHMSGLWLPNKICSPTHEWQKMNGVKWMNKMNEIGERGNEVKNFGGMKYPGAVTGNVWKVFCMKTGPLK